MAYTTVDDPSAHFQVDKYTADGSSDTVTFDGNSNLKPDLIWVKSIDTAYNAQFHDSSRGATAGAMYTNLGDAEDSTYHVDNFLTDGYINDSVNTAIHDNNENIMSYGWKANGGTTSSNTNGSITSTVQANTDAGFSIVQYTGTGTAATIGHGLGVAPDMYIVKNRDQTGTNWTIFHKDLTSNAYSLYLNSTAAQSNSVGYWNGTSPTSTVFSIKNTSGDVNTNTEDYVVYCFAEKQGYSKFGSYEGNGDADGTFVYTGFKPAWLVVKGIDSTGPWYIVDNKRNPYNLTNKHIPTTNEGGETSAATGLHVDLLSNGFKLRDDWSDTNEADETFIYAAFAEQSFVTSGGVPATAR